MKPIFRFLILGLSLLITPVSFAQTMYAIIFAVTDDVKLGKAFKGNAVKFEKFLNNVRAATGQDIVIEMFTGADAIGANVDDILSEISGYVGPDDTVLFLYTGHGAHKDGDPDPFPTMCLNGSGSHNDRVKLSDVEKKIAAMNPRLRIILSECCNMTPSGKRQDDMRLVSADYDYLDDYDTSAFNKLFFEDKGRVQLTSSKLDEYSWAINEEAKGGLFFQDLMSTFEKVGTNNTAADWTQIVSLVKLLTSQRSIMGGDPPKPYKQHPYFDYSVNGKASKNGEEAKPDTKPYKPDPKPYKPDPKPYKPKSGLAEALRTISDQNIPEAERRAMIPSLKNKYFTSSAKVKTVATDCETIIDYEDIDLFLQRVVSSPFIYQINLLEGGDGVNNVITVSELRKRK